MYDVLSQNTRKAEVIQHETLNKSTEQAIFSELEQQQKILW